MLAICYAIIKATMLLWQTGSAAEMQRVSAAKCCNCYLSANLSSANFTKLLRVAYICVCECASMCVFCPMESNTIHTISCHHSALNTRLASGFDIKAKPKAKAKAKCCKNSLQKLAWQHVRAVSQLARATAHSSCQHNMQYATCNMTPTVLPLSQLTMK